MPNRNYPIYLLIIFVPTMLFGANAFSQGNYKEIPLPKNISDVNEEFSGLATWGNRLYLLPQYGSHKDTELKGDFFIYSISCDSIGRVIDKKDASLTSYRTIKIRNLAKLPDSIKKNYEGFEAITIVNGKVFLSIETSDSADYCFLLKGRLDTIKNEINIDPIHYAAIKRYPYIKNAGFESLAYLSKENKLLAFYEYNGVPDGGIGFLIDTAFKKPLIKLNTPFLYFRITDITTTKNDKIYGINYFWNGDYDSYLNNNMIRHAEEKLKTAIPDLKDSLNNNPSWLKEKTTCYARIMSLENYKSRQWKEVTRFECEKNNWEGLVLFRMGALVISDANRSGKQVTELAYVRF